ncbi:adhesion G protein-coupled receptor F5-like [Silurus meridionalis]|uniref:adhesion G protein-coupled receptor F5-like n=1 Tax=Silurus meridionalis TaxID=175797 RepID=UPI001EEB011F|nr:adhesion G protein-coupled receptor F5-like [Silurus meridionalis]
MENIVSLFPSAEYLFEVELGAVDITILNPVGILSATSNLTVKKSNITITKMNITTVCSMNSTVYQCRCEDQYFWPCEKCTVYGSCDDVSNILCGCINNLPNDGHLCQPLTEMTNKSSCSAPTTRAEFQIEMEVDALDMTILNPMRNVLMILSLLSMNRNINITEMNITTGG